MRIASATILSLLALACAGQESDAIKLRASKVVEQLSAPAFHGRGYVADGDHLASAWIAEQFEAMRLIPVGDGYFQPFKFDVNTFPDSVKVSIDGHALVPGVDFIVGPASGTAAGTFDLVHLTPEVFADPERKAVVMGMLPGHAACLHFPASAVGDTLARYAAIERELMHYCPVVRPQQGKLTWGVSQEAMPFPLIEVKEDLIAEDATRITLQVKNTFIPQRASRNVMGMIKGKSKKWVVVGAHYDHLGHMGPDVIFPGANDNASGVAMMLSLADHFRKHKPKDNLLFVAFAGEEAGLVGSEWCAVDRPIEWKNVKLMLNLDIMGTGDEGVTVVNATAQPAAYKSLVKINDKRQYLSQVKERGPSCNSDHCPFVKRGVPAIFIYTMGGITAYHDVYDRYSTLPLTEFADVHYLLRDFIGTVR